MRKPVLAEGDFVRFLNDRLEGRVVRILPGEKAVVEIEDGFPVETVFSELVKIEDGSVKAIPQEIPKKPELGPLVPSSPFPLEAGVHLLLVPYAEKVHSGPWQVQLHNSGTTPILYSIFFDLPLQSVHPCDHGALSPGQILHLGDASVEHKTINCEIALMFHQRPMSDPGRFHRLRLTLPKPGIQVLFPTLPAPFCFATSACVCLSRETQENETIDLGKIRLIQEAMSGSGRTSPTTATNAKPGSGSHEMVVDLHIENIVTGRPPKGESQLLQIQLNHFKKELDGAILKGCSVIYFIHGVGNGILRNAIRKELDVLGLRYSDGPAKRFGQGATRVNI